MTTDTDGIIAEAQMINHLSKRIKICFDALNGEVGFDIDFRKRASLMCHMQAITYTTYPLFSEEGDYIGYMDDGKEISQLPQRSN